MSIPNFPSTGLVPNVTTFAVGNIIYKWDGEKWKTITAPLKADQITWKDGSVQDFIDGIKPISILSNFEVYRRSYAEAGYNLVEGSFEAGGTLVNDNDVLLQESTGKAFSGPAGTVAAGTNPSSGGFVDRSGAVLFSTALENIKRNLKSIGLNLVGSFEFGCSLTKARDVVISFGDGLVYRYAGPFPYTVVKGTPPSTAGFTDIQANFTAAAAQQLADNFTLKKAGDVPPTITVPAGTAYISGSGSERADIDGINLVGDGKNGTDGTMGIHWLGDVSSNQPIRNQVKNFRIGGVKTAGIRMSAGWGNLIAEGRITDIGGNGLDIVESPILSGWGGSGSVVRNLYAANCGGNGISNVTGWCFTFINPVLEYNNSPFRERGNNSVWINPWLEGNTNSPLIERGVVILGGRGVSYRATLPDDLSSFEPLEAVTRIHNRGIQVFRDDTDRVFDVDGEGVKRIRSKTTLGLTLDGAITAFDSNRRNGFNFKCVTNNTSPQIKTNPRNVSGIKGVATADSADGGSHYGRVVLYSGVIGSTQNTVADRWEVRFDGAFHPTTDNAVTVGRASERPSVIYAATGTINTSDGREKTELRPFDDAFLDAVDDISIGLYQWLVEIERKGDAARTHTGAIAQQIRDAFMSHGIDATEYGLLCYDEWEDEWEDVYVDVRTPISDSEGVIVGYEVPQEPTGERRLLTAAGNRWGLREAQVHWALHAAARRKFDRLEHRIAALEGMSAKL